MNLVASLALARQAGARILGVVGRDGGYTAQVADACLIIPTLSPETVTPHTEEFQAVVWHLLVSHPRLRANEMKWESAMNRPAIFLDRDGVLNSMVLNPGTGRMESPLTAAEFRLIEGVIPALLQLQNAGYPLILVSNQPNFALGKSSYDYGDANESVDEDGSAYGWGQVAGTANNIFMGGGQRDRRRGSRGPRGASQGRGRGVSGCQKRWRRG